MGFRFERNMSPVFDYRAFVQAAIDKAKKYLGKFQSKLASEGLSVKIETIESSSASHTITNYKKPQGGNRRSSMP